MTIDDVRSKHRALDKRIAEQAIMWWNLLLEEGIIQGCGRKCKMQSYQYELIRKAVTTNGPEGDEVVVKDGAVIKTGSVLVQPNANPPTREGLLFEHHDEVAEAGGPDKVEVNIRPFCG